MLLKADELGASRLACPLSVDFLVHPCYPVGMDESRTYEFKPVNQLVFSDDFMFGAVMREPDICKGVLELLLQVKIDHIGYLASLAGCL